MQTVKSFIFDLGGVLIDLDFSRFEQSFETLGFHDFSHHFDRNFRTTPFVEYETGKINEETFINTLKKFMTMPVNNDRVIEAWNSILLSFRPGSLQFIKALKRKYKVFLYSNTNYTHFIEFQKRVPEQVMLEQFFDATYYSFRIGFKKPDPDGFRFILKENNLIAGETVFVDDSSINIVGAEALGFQTHHLTAGHRIEDMLSGYL